MLKAITFDFWDTLYKAPQGTSLSERRAALVGQVLKDMGYELEELAIRVAFEVCWQYAHHYQLECELDLTPWGQVDFILNHLNINLNREESERVYQVYTAVLKGYPPHLNDGAIEAIPLLAEKYKLAVICNTGVSPGIILRELMKADGIYRYFEFAVFSDEVRWAKPNVKIFNYALEKLQVKSIEAAHVGDDSSTDVIGAKRAGMKSVWLAPQPGDGFVDTDYQIKKLTELLTLFDD